MQDGELLAHDPTDAEQRLDVAASLGKPSISSRTRASYREPPTTPTWRSGLGSPRCDGPNPVDSYRTGDVFEPLLAEILERKVELARYVLPHPRRHTNAAWIGQAFEPRRNIYPVAENIPVLYNDIALVNADPKFDAFLGGENISGIASG